MGFYGAQRAMKAIYDVPAPAKVNLFLHIVGRRPDGYHLLQSVFMLIDWCDSLHFERTASTAITRQDLTSALPEDDLILRAARALQHASGCTFGAHISIDKQIPAQAGMGGGSSDAASTLLALNRLWGLHFSLEQLAALGLKLGADVPFFLCGQHAWVQGIGEDMTPIQLPKARLDGALHRGSRRRSYSSKNISDRFGLATRDFGPTKILRLQRCMEGENENRK
jgi:4-diphosphocytidyl-2-C-methyl-D-erythritol kinase